MYVKEFEGRAFAWLNPLEPWNPRGTMFYKVMAVMFLDMLTSIGLTLLAILIISLLLTVDLTISLLSCAAVAATVVDTAGLAHFWGLVVEPFFAVLPQNTVHYCPLLFNLFPGAALCHRRDHCRLRHPRGAQLPCPGFLLRPSPICKNTSKVLFFLFHRKFSGRRQQSNPGLSLPQKALHVDPDPA